MFTLPDKEVHPLKHPAISVTVLGMLGALCSKEQPLKQEFTFVTESGNGGGVVILV